MRRIGTAQVLRRFGQYGSAEDCADQFKGDCQPDKTVHVVQDFEPESDGYAPYGGYRFLVVLGNIPDSDRYEVQYTA